MIEVLEDGFALEISLIDIERIAKCIRQARKLEQHLLRLLRLLLSDRVLLCSLGFFRCGLVALFSGFRSYTLSRFSFVSFRFFKNLGMGRDPGR